MKIHFEMTPEFSEKDPHILIQAAQLTDQAREVMDSWQILIKMY